MTNQEKAKEELVEVFIEYCKKRKEIESVKISKGLDGCDRAKLRQTTLDFLEKRKEMMKKYQIDNIDFSGEEMLEIYKKYYW